MYVGHANTSLNRSIGSPARSFDSMNSTVLRRRGCE